MSFLTPDVVRHLSTYLMPTDILHVGMTCKTLAQSTINNQKLWRYYVTQKFPNIPIAGIGELDVEWKAYAFCQSAAVVRRKLQMYHLERRLGADQRSPDYLRFFCSISTPGDETHILTCSAGIKDREKQKARRSFTSFTDLERALNWLDNGSDDSDEDNAGGADQGLNWAASASVDDSDLVSITFAHPRSSSVLFWRGEKDRRSKLRVYCVDRQRTPNQLDLKPLSVRPAQTILGKSQYQHIGRLAYQDANYFDSGGGGMAVYNFSTDHSRFRDLGASDSRTGMGSSTRIREMPPVAVQAWTSVTCDLQLSYLFGLFCGGTK